ARLRVIDLEPLAHHFGFVVLALDQRFTGKVVATLVLRRIELDVIGAPARDVHTATIHALDDVGIRDCDLEHHVDLDLRILEAVGLANGAWEPVEQVALLTIRSLQALLDETDDDVVRHQLTCIHHFFRGKTEGRSGLYRRAQHVTGGNLRNAEALLDERRLGAFAGARRTKKYQTHPR